MLKSLLNRLSSRESEGSSPQPDIQTLQQDKERLEEALSHATGIPKIITINNKTYAVTADGYGETVKKIE